MPITKDEVLAEAKKIGIALSETEALVFVRLNMLPVKSTENDPPAGGNNDDNDDDDSPADDKLPKSVKERLAKLAKQKKDAEQRAKVAEDEAAKRKAEDDKKDKERLAADGKFKELSDKAMTELENSRKTTAALRERIKINAINSTIEVALLAAGCPAERIQKALKLFPFEDVGFSWTNEETCTYDITPITDTMSKFKTENDFLFTSVEDNSSSGRSGPGARNPAGTSFRTSKEKVAEQHAKLEELFPALRGVSVNR
jgi:hypothetical protein